MNVEQQTGALMALVEADRECQCAQILAPAQAQAESLWSRARADALTQLREVFAQQRSRRHDALAAAQAKLATQRRLNEQQRTTSLLQQAWVRLPDELLAACAPWLKADAAIRAGIKIVSGGNVIDGTLTGLLTDRGEFESQLLRLLEAAE
jgi:hypothetical protein